MVLMTHKLVKVYYNFPQFASLPSRLETRKNSFAVRVPKPWNSLPEKVVTASRPIVSEFFKQKFDKFWQDQLVRFNFREELRT